MKENAVSTKNGGGRNGTTIEMTTVQREITQHPAINQYSICCNSCNSFTCISFPTANDVTFRDKCISSVLCTLQTIVIGSVIGFIVWYTFTDIAKFVTDYWLDKLDLAKKKRSE